MVTKVQRKAGLSLWSLIAILFFLAVLVDAVDAASFRTGQATVDDDPAVTIGTATNRHKLEVRTTGTVFCGGTGVTATTGVIVTTTNPLVVDDHSGPFSARAVVKCITATGSVTVSYIEYTE